MNEALVFCTSSLDSNPSHYQDWLNYYTDFFKNQSVDLLMVNDGPCEKIINFKEVEQVVLEPFLGKDAGLVNPGFKRSFYYGLIHSIQKKYKRVAFIDNDCFIHEKSKETFIKHLFSDGYHVGFSRAYKLIECSVQIINEKWILNYLIDRYSCYDNWYENVNFEKMLMMILRPSYFLNGDKIEGKADRFKKEYDFLSKCTYKEFLEFYKDEELL